MPGALAFGPNGHLYVADFGGGAIYEYDTASATQQYLSANTLSLGYTPGGLAFTTGGDLVVGDLDAQAVFQYHAGSLSATLLSPGSGVNPAALLTEPDNGDLLIADLDFGFEPTQHHQIVRYDYGTTTSSQFIDLTHPLGTGASAGLPPQPTSMLLDRDGNLLVGLSPDHNLDGAVEKFNIDNGALMETLVTGIGTPTGLGLVPASVPELDLNGAAAGTGYTSSWTGFAVLPVAITDSANATVSDSGVTNLTQLTAALTSPHTGDSLSANNSAAPGIAVSFAGGTLTLSGSDTLANYQAVLRTIKYTNTAGGPLVDSFTINLQASDGSLSSNVAVATVTFPPILDLNGGVGGTGNTAGWFNSGPVPITDMADATITAPSGLANLTGITVVESTFHTGDVLSVPSVFGISGISQSYSAGTLSLSGSNSVANYQKLLRLLNYDNTSGGPGVSSFTASVTATDGVLTSAPVTATINSTVLTGEVLGNRLFYNGSKYDNNHTAIEPASDALAIASDKIGFSGSGTATFANVSSFSRGITGVMIDSQSGIGAHGSISLADFSFHTSPAYSAGTYNNIGTWNTAPTPSGFSVILGGGTDGSDRLEITWNANDIKNEWLEVELGRQRQHRLERAGHLLLRQRRGRIGLGQHGQPDHGQRHRRDRRAQQSFAASRHHARVERGRLQQGRHRQCQRRHGVVWQQRLHAALHRQPHRPVSPRPATAASAAAWRPRRLVPAVRRRLPRAPGVAVRAPGERRQRELEQDGRLLPAIGGREQPGRPRAARGNRPGRRGSGPG